MARNPLTVVPGWLTFLRFFFFLNGKASLYSKEDAEMKVTGAILSILIKCNYVGNHLVLLMHILLFCRSDDQKKTVTCKLSVALCCLAAIVYRKTAKGRNGLQAQKSILYQLC